MKYRVSHDKHGDIVVEASNRLQAVYRAAKAWKVPDWTALGRTCTVTWLGPIKEAGQ